MKILIIDIETSPNLAYVWGLWKQNVAINQLVQAGSVLSFAAKWLGEEKYVFRSSFHHGMTAMVEKAHQLLNEADAVVTYNGISFDIPILNTTFIQHGMLPPAPPKQIDLLPVVKKMFRFPSNKLEYVSRALGCAGKANDGMTFEIWEACMTGDPDAWEQMRKYNIQDVLITEQVYTKLRPWIYNHPNVALYDSEFVEDDMDEDVDKLVCPRCGKKALRRNGTRTTIISVYRRYQCKECGAWSRGRKNIAKRENQVHGNLPSV